jgi:hypothetical protein
MAIEMSMCLDSFFDCVDCVSIAWGILGTAVYWVSELGG